jgi:hypothetical protein
MCRRKSSYCRPNFSGCGKRIVETISEIENGILDLNDLPFITVLRAPDGNYFSLNNRRLYVLKHLRSTGFLESRSNAVKVRVKLPLPRELKKYSTTRCSLVSRIMKERPALAGEDAANIDSNEEISENEEDESEAL